MASRQSDSKEDPVLELINSAKALQSNRVDLSRRNLSRIPDQLLELVKLEYLYLEGNGLSELPSTLFESLGSLKWLDLRKNCLKEIPKSIGKHRVLKTLLLDDNDMKALPVELGMVRSITGIHLGNNPLDFPPKNIVQQGTQAILQFLREQTLPDEILPPEDPVRDEKSSPSSEKPNHSGYEDRWNSLEAQHKHVRRYSDPTHKNVARWCMTTTDPLSSMLTVRPPIIYGHERRRSSRHRKLSHSHQLCHPRGRSFSLGAIKCRQTTAMVDWDMKGKAYSADRIKVQEKKKKEPLFTPGTGYLRKQSVESKMKEEIQNLKKKMFNESADGIIQKRKDKQARDDWHLEARRMQRHKESLARMQGLHFQSPEPPFGTEDQKDQVAITEHAKQVKEALDLKDRAKITRSDDIVVSIQKHIANMEERRHMEKPTTVEDEVEQARRNLEEALRLQKKLEERRALEYRLRAFTADDFFPPKHATTKSTKGSK